MARIEEGRDLSYLLDERMDAEELAYYHSLDISGSVYTRMKELGLSRSKLAKRMGVHRSVVTRIIKGNENLTLKTIAKLEEALDFRLDSGFRYAPVSIKSEPTAYGWQAEAERVEDTQSEFTTTAKLTGSVPTHFGGGLAA